MLCCRHSSAVDNPASPCFRIAMICSSLCRVPFTRVSFQAQHVTSAIPASVTSLVRENSHCRWSSFWGLGQCHRDLYTDFPNGVAFRQNELSRPSPVRAECRSALHWLQHECVQLAPCIHSGIRAGKCFTIASNFSAMTLSLGYANSLGAGKSRRVGNTASFGGGVTTSPNPISIWIGIRAF